MKPEQFSYPAGHRFVVKIEELLASAELLVSFDGYLLRVKNTSKYDLKKGDKIQLIVARENPLELQIYMQSSASLDRRI